MRLKKNRGILLLLFCIAFTLAACSNGAQESQNQAASTQEEEPRQVQEEQPRSAPAQEQEPQAAEEPTEEIDAAAVEQAEPVEQNLEDSTELTALPSVETPIETAAAENTTAEVPHTRNTPAQEERKPQGETAAATEPSRPQDDAPAAEQAKVIGWYHEFDFDPNYKGEIEGYIYNPFTHQYVKDDGSRAEEEVYVPDPTLDPNDYWAPVQTFEDNPYLTEEEKELIRQDQAARAAQRAAEKAAQGGD